MIKLWQATGMGDITTFKQNAKSSGSYSYHIAVGNRADAHEVKQRCNEQARTLCPQHIDNWHWKRWSQNTAEHRQDESARSASIAVVGTNLE